MSLELPELWATVEVGERWPVIRSGQREPINRTMRRLIYRRDDHTCVLCGRRSRLLELDHIVPWSAGGADTSDNLRSVCHQCNTDRSNFRTTADYPAIPVTLACDACIVSWAMSYGVSRYGRVVPGAPDIEAFCGNCEQPSIVSDPARLK